MALFRIKKENVLLLEVALEHEVMNIGRSQESDIRLADLTVSRLHARVRRHPDGRHWIEDLNSTNAVYVNDYRLAEPMLLCDGDVVRIGTYVLEFSDAAEAEAYRSEITRLFSLEMILPSSSKEASPGVVGALVNEANNAIFVITAGRATLGNQGEVDIRVPATTPLRASVSQQGTEFYVCSETTAPCVRVNGTPVMNAKLAFNDRIEVGGRRFIFREI